MSPLLGAGKNIAQASQISRNRIVIDLKVALVGDRRARLIERRPHRAQELERIWRHLPVVRVDDDVGLDE